MIQLQRKPHLQAARLEQNHHIVCDILGGTISLAILARRMHMTCDREDVCELRWDTTYSASSAVGEQAVSV